MHIRADASSTPKPLDGVMGQPRDFKIQAPYERPCRSGRSRTRPRHPWHAYEPARAASRGAETACSGIKGIALRRRRSVSTPLRPVPGRQSPVLSARAFAPRAVTQLVS